MPAAPRSRFLLAAILPALAVAGAAPRHAAPAPSAGKRAITFDDLVATRLPESLSLSPDGARLAFALRTYDEDHARYLRQVYVEGLPEGPARQFTYRVEGASEPRWSPDGAWIAFLAGETAGAGAGDDPDPGGGSAPHQVFAMPADGGEAHALTRMESGVEGFTWRPDASGIVALAEEAPSAPQKELKAKDLDAKNDGAVILSDRRRLQFWTVDLKDGAARRINDGDLGVDPGFSLSPDGRSIVYSTNLTGAPGAGNAYDLYVLDVASGASRRLTDRAGAEKRPVFSPDGRQVAFVAPAQADVSFSRATLFVVPAAGGAPPRALSARTDRDIDEEEEVLWTPDGQGVLAVIHRGTNGPLWRFDAASGEGREVVGGRRVCSWPAVSRAGRLAFVGQGPEQAPEIQVASLDGAGLRQAGELNTQAREWDIAPSEVIRFKSFDGKEVEGILVKPRGGRPGTRWPLLVYPHGGPQWRDPDILVEDRQAYAAQGYAVLLVEFRGSTGYGNDWNVADMKDLGGGDFKDLMAGVDKVIAMGVADPKRLGIFGGSYGGYMTNWAITQTDRFKGAVSWYGIWNLVTDFSNSFYTEWEPDYLRTHYWDDWEAYLSRSPARHVRKVATPVLILHGEEDENTNIANSREMWTALKSLGKPVEFVHYPREGHGFEEPVHQKDVFRRTLRHMDRYVKGGAAAEARPGETVSAGGLDLLVASVERQDGLAGRRPASGSIFLAVTLVIDDRRPKPGPLSLRVGGSGSEVRLESAAGASVVPLGTLAPALGEDILVAGTADLAVGPEQDGTRHPVSAVVIFEIPDRGGLYRLKVKQFAPVAVEVAGDSGEAG